MEIDPTTIYVRTRTYTSYIIYILCIVRIFMKCPQIGINIKLIL